MFPLEPGLEPEVGGVGAGLHAEGSSTIVNVWANVEQGVVGDAVGDIVGDIVGDAVGATLAHSVDKVN